MNKKTFLVHALIVAFLLSNFGLNMAYAQSRVPENGPLSPAQPAPPQVDTDDQASGIVPCTNRCDFMDIIKLVKSVINTIMWIAIPLATLMIAWAGFTYMTTGVSDKKSKAKTMLTNVFIGFGAMLAAWVIVNTIVKALAILPPSVNFLE